MERVDIGHFTPTRLRVFQSQDLPRGAYEQMHGFPSAGDAKHPERYPPFMVEIVHAVFRKHFIGEGIVAFAGEGGTIVFSFANVGDVQRLKVIEVVANATGHGDHDLFTMGGDFVPGCEFEPERSIPREDAPPPHLKADRTFLEHVGSG